MSQLELYAVLRSLGVEDEQAKAAVQDMSVVTKDVLKAELLELETRLQRFIIQAMLGMTAIFAFIVGLFRVFT